MVINRLEYSIIRKFLEVEGLPFSDITEFELKDRIVREAGFLTEVSSKKVLDVAVASKIYDSIPTATIDGQLCGFLIYIRDRRVESLEGFSYGSSFPFSDKEVLFSVG